MTTLLLCTSSTDMREYGLFIIRKEMRSESGRPSDRQGNNKG